jgi:hypothetical protein
MLACDQIEHTPRRVSIAMLKPLVIASLIASASSAARADDANARRMRPEPLFEVNVVAGRTHAKITSTTVWASGAWSFEDFRSKTPKTSNGRLDADQVRALREELAGTPWKHTYSQASCVTPVIETEYRVSGKVVFDDANCADQLDAVSLETLAFARGFVAGAVAPTTTRTSCVRDGKPLVEIEDRGGTVERTWAVYATGAWQLTTQPGSPAGGQATTEDKCLGKDVIAKIEADIDAASWTISHPIHCMAMSTESRVVKINGKTVFTERMCNPDKLDDTSARSLADIKSLIGVK